MPRAQLEGLKVGRLYVDSFAYAKNGRTFWNCTCDCGNKCIIKGKYLSNGDTKSCGCLNLERIQQQGFSNKNRNKYEYIDENTLKVYFHNSDDYFLCDAEDIQYIENATWHKSNQGYARGKIDGKLQFFHDVVLNLEPNTNQMCDYINRDRLDNRKNNLRIVNLSINILNRSIYENNSSGMPSVYKSNNKWQSQIQINGNNINLGRYDTFEEAKQARLNAEKELLKDIKYEYTEKYQSDNQYAEKIS